MVTIEPLSEDDRTAWEALFRGYMEFYRNVPEPGFYDWAWDEFRSGARMHVLGARIGDDLVGITHFLVHPSTWGPDVCYLEDLFTAPHVRGRGVARGLIEAVAGWAREQGCASVYWQTHESNATARRLYDDVALNEGYVVYRLPL